MENFDLVVIGAGAGGYVAAIHAAKNGMKVALVEKNRVGGACYNNGCVPSKIMLEHSKLLQEFRRAQNWGIEADEIRVNFPQLMKRKDEIVDELLYNIEGYVRESKIRFYRGEANVSKDLTVTVTNHSFKAKDIILATGSRPFVPPFQGLETASYMTTDTFFKMTELPKQLTIIGGGVIAVELAFSLAPLGTKITMLNHSEDILQTEEPEARPLIRKKMKELGIELVTDFRFDYFEGHHIHTSKGIFTYEHLLFATGRCPNIEIAKSLGLEMDGRLLAVNEHYETSLPHIYAIGDLVGGFQLAHAASAEGKHVVDYLLGKTPAILDQMLIPRCVYSHPEIATFGLLDCQVEEAHTLITLPLNTNPKALMEGNRTGFVKLIVSKKDAHIIGACVVSDGATEILNSILALKVAGGTAEQLSKVIFPHPTVSEHIGEAASAVFGIAASALEGREIISGK